MRTAHNRVVSAKYLQPITSDIKQTFRLNDYFDHDTTFLLRISLWDKLTK